MLFAATPFTRRHRLRFMEKRTNKYLTPGAVVFNIIFILAYPIIALFTFAYTVLVWIFSVPSRVAVWVARQVRREKTE